MPPTEQRRSTTARSGDNLHTQAAMHTRKAASAVRSTCQLRVVLARSLLSPGFTPALETLHSPVSNPVLTHPKGSLPRGPDAYRPIAFSIFGRASRNTRVITAWGAMLQRGTHTRHSTAQHGTAQTVSTPEVPVASKPEAPAASKPHGLAESLRAWPVGARIEPATQWCGCSCCLVAWPRCGGFAGWGFHRPYCFWILGRASKNISVNTTWGAMLQCARE